MPVIGKLDPTVLQARQRHNLEVKEQQGQISRQHRRKIEAFTPVHGQTLSTLMPESLKKIKQK